MRCFLLDSSKKRKIFIYVLIGLVVLFALWFAFNIFTHIRRGIDTNETVRQAEIIDGIFNFEENVVQAARYIMGNDDIVAHLAVPGTSISYAVVQTIDNEFYLDHDLLRRPNSNGSIFLDYLNSPYFTDKSTIIYGHNRSDGTMLYDIQLFMDYEFFWNNEHMIVTTDSGELVYEIFVIFATHINFNYIQVDFADEDEFLSLVYQMKDRATHLRDIEISGEDRILILSTCTNIGPTGRLVLVGRLI